MKKKTKTQIQKICDVDCENGKRAFGHMTFEHDNEGIEAVNYLKTKYGYDNRLDEGFAPSQWGFTYYKPELR